MIDFQPLSESRHSHFAKDLFESSFPDDERPPFGELLERNQNNFHFLIASIDDDEPIGFLTYWTFEEFVYVEHFAIAEEYRNHGLGKAVFVNFLALQTEQVVLEIEMPTTDTAERRLEFYCDLGLIRNPQDYWQPSYYENKLELPMLLMSKYELDDDEYQEVVNILYENVYHYTQK